MDFQLCDVTTGEWPVKNYKGEIVATLDVDTHEFIVELAVVLQPGHGLDLDDLEYHETIMTAFEDDLGEDWEDIGFRVADEGDLTPDKTRYLVRAEYSIEQLEDFFDTLPKLNFLPREMDFSAEDIE